MTVAPLVGAWIEIKAYMLEQKEADVAPLVGAWIEIFMPRAPLGSARVAPLVGAWIEINDGRNSGNDCMSLLSWERGLKSVTLYVSPGTRCRSSRGSVD